MVLTPFDGEASYKIIQSYDKILTMTNSKLLNQFRSFYFRNYPDDMEIQIEYFAVFGGLG